MVMPNALHKLVGQRVRALRLEQGVTQAELAGKLGLDETTIRSIEAGRRGMSLETLTRLAKELRADPGALIATGNAAGQPLSEAAQLLSEMTPEWRLTAVRVLRELHGTVTGRPAAKRKRAR